MGWNRFNPENKTDPASLGVAPWRAGNLYLVIQGTCDFTWMNGMIVIEWMGWWSAMMTPTSSRELEPPSFRSWNVKNHTSRDTKKCVQHKSLQPHLLLHQPVLAQQDFYTPAIIRGCSGIATPYNSHHLSSDVATTLGWVWYGIV